MNDLKARNWCGTINNYTEEDYTKALELSKATYAIVGKEVASSGTPHLQCYWRFSNSIRFSTLKKIFPTAHLEPAKSDCASNVIYCSKEGRWEDRGERPDPEARIRGIIYPSIAHLYQIHLDMKNTVTNFFTPCPQELHYHLRDLWSITGSLMDSIHDLTEDIDVIDSDEESDNETDSEDEDETQSHPYGTPNTIRRLSPPDSPYKNMQNK